MIVVHNTKRVIVSTVLKTIRMVIKKGMKRMEKEPKTICDDCIHDVVCGDEGHLDPALIRCAEKKPVSLLKRRELLLIDIIQYLETGKWFTVIRRTGETCNKITYTYPERFKVVGINFEPSEQKICVIVEEA